MAAGRWDPRRRLKAFDRRRAAHPRLIIVVVGLVVAVVSCSATSSATTGPRAQRTSYQLLASYPHDATAFTQGLVWVDGRLYESTGLNGASTLRQVDLSSGKVVQSHQLLKSDFGEGLTAVGNQLVQLTWKGHHGYVYDRTSLAPMGQFSYPAEGWGLTYDGHQLITSDGSATLRFLDPISYRQTRTLTVTMDGKPLAQLNELEYIRGQIWANVWHRDIIVHINPRTGSVTSYLDLTGILPPDQIRPILTIDDHPVDSRYAQDDLRKKAVLNGIAYDPTTDRVFVTGKL